MNRNVLRIVHLVGLACALGATATGQTTTAPATQPAESAVDASSPQGALKLLSIAMRQGDEPAMRTLMLVGNDQERKVVDAQIAQSRAFASFRAAAVVTFGDIAANEITGDVAAAAAQQMAKIDAAEVKIDGDAAVVTMGADVYTLKKFGQGWKVAISGLLKDSTPEVVAQIVRDMTDQTSVVQETADEVLQGKYRTTEEVAVAFRGKALKVQMDRAAAVSAATEGASTTQPDR